MNKTFPFIFSIIYKLLYNYGSLAFSRYTTTYV